MKNRSTAVVLRPGLFSRAVGWAMGALGLLFAISGFTDFDLGTLISMGTFGLLFAAIGLCLATASLKARPTGIRYRNGRTVHIPASRIAAIVVGPSNGAFYPRVAVTVECTDGEHLTLTALQRADSQASRRRLEADSQAISDVLGLPPRNA